VGSNPTTFTKLNGMVKTKIQIIDELVDYYLVDPDVRRCKNRTYGYRIIDGNKYTPFGYCLLQRYKKNTDFTSNNYEEIGFLCNLYNSTFDELIEPKYRGNGFEFWNDLNEFHRSNHYWTPLKLSKKGEEHLDRLRIKWRG
jgi:hypothetical protein